MILFVQTAFLGDLLLSIPTLKQLRKIYPNQEIHLVCRKGLGSIIKKFDLVDIVHDDFASTKPTLGEWRRRFKDKSFDLLLCPHESSRSRLFCMLTTAKVKIGYKFFLSKFVFTQSISRPKHLPEALRQMFLLTTIDLEMNKELSQLPRQFQTYNQVPQWSSMVMYSESQKREFKRELCERLNVDKSHAVVAIAPGSVWATKRWPLEHFVEVAKDLIDQQKVVIIVGSKDEKPLGEEIQRRVPEVMNLCGETSLATLSEVLGACDALVCNDSGSMHMAAVANTPIVSVFGPTVLEFGYQPWSNDFIVLEKKNLKCRPCSLHGGEKCPIGTHECMKMIRSDEAIAALGSFVDIK